MTTSLQISPDQCVDEECTTSVLSTEQKDLSANTTDFACLDLANPHVPLTSSVTKSQLKKRRRIEHKIEWKKRRKEQDKAIKLIKAKFAGRNISQEQIIREEKLKLNHQEQRPMKNDTTLSESFEICIDCSFDSLMSAKEIKSLAMQIRCCYASNRRNKHPFHLIATSLKGTTLDHLRNVDGFDEWRNRGFSYTSDSMEVSYEGKLDKLVYITDDSDNTLHEFEKDKIYVIGGLVYRNPVERASWNRANHLNIATARLPIECLDELKGLRRITYVHVFEMILNYQKTWMSRKTSSAT